MLHIAHLVNPVRSPVYSELSRVQPITFESMRIAATYAEREVKVDLLSAQYAEDHPVIPDFFKKTPDLERSAADFGNFTAYRKLPLIRDLLDRLFEGSDAPYLIYTNVDICLQPHFYLEVANKIRSGLDAFMINRRRIPATFSTIDELPQMYACRGRSHPGFDCFVFRRELYPLFQLEKVCVGIPFIEMVVSQNLFCHARNCRVFDRDFLTFHIGMEVFKKRDGEYLRHNRLEFWKAMRKLWVDLDSRKYPWGERNLFYRMIRWGLHPCIPIRLALMLEPRRYLHIFRDHRSL